MSTDDTVQKVSAYLARQDAKKRNTPLAPEFLSIVRELAIMRAKMDHAAEVEPDDIAPPMKLPNYGLFPSESEIAARLSQDAKRWASIAPVLEREGLPKIDPLMEGRFWPAVVAFFNARYGLETRPPRALDGEEDLFFLR